MGILSQTHNGLNFVDSEAYIQADGTTVMTIKSGGNIGIGTTSPSAKLDVAGTLKASGAVTLSNYASGLLQVDANGLISVDTNTYLTSETDSQTLSWADASNELTISNGNTVEITGFADASHNHDSTYLKLSGGTVTGATSFDSLVTFNGNIRLNDGTYTGDWGGLESTQRAANSHDMILYVADDGGTGDRIKLVSRHYSQGDTDYAIFDSTYAYLYKQLYIGTVNASTTHNQALVLDGNVVKQRTLGSAAFSTSTDFVAVAGDSMTGNLLPGTDSTLRLGDSTNRWLQVHTRGVTSEGNTLDLRGSAIKLYNGANTAMTINSSGDIGIGTTSPQAGKRLDVRSDASIAGSNAIAGYGYNDSGIAILANGYATSGTGRNYGLYGISTGTRTGGTNVGGHFSASGAGTNYALTTGSGNVGIGTSDPAYKLDISGGDIRINRSDARLLIGWQLGSGGIQLEGGGTTASTLYFKSDRFRFYTDSAQEIVSLTQAGNVGIGTTSPAQKLHVAGTGRFTDNLYSTSTDVDGIKTRFLSGAANNSTNNGTLYLQYGKSNPVSIGETGSSDLYVAGNVGIGTTSPNSRLNVKSSGSNTDEITLTHSGNTVNIVAIGQESSHGSLFLRANSGVNKVRLSAAGNNSYILDSNVGIGTTSPAFRLDVDGSVNLTGFYFNGINQAAGIEYTAPLISTGTYSRDSTNNASDEWVKVISYSGSPRRIRLWLNHGGDNTNMYDEYLISHSSYGMQTHIYRLPGSKYNTSKVLGIKAINSSGAVQDVWVKIAGITSGSGSFTYRANVSVQDSTNVAASSQSTEPLGTTGSSVLYISDSNRNEFTTMSSGGGYFGGNISIGTATPTANLHITSSGTPIKMSRSGYDDYGFVQSAGTGLQIQNFTDNRTEMFFNGGGNVGIGTTSPAHPLHVNGAGRFQGALEVNYGVSTADAAINLGVARTDSGYAYLDLVGDTTYTDYGLRVIRGNAGANASSQINHRGTGDFELRALEAANITFDTNATERMRINSGGNVGIGTTSPGHKLDVGGSININNISYAYKINDLNVLSVSANYTNLYNPEGAISIYLGDSGDRTNYYDNNFHRFRTAGGSSDYMFINSNGNVGIGTTSPSAKLSVIGDAGLYGTVSGGIVTPASLKFFTSENNSGLSNSNKHNIGQITWTGKDGSQNTVGEYAAIKSYLIDSNNLIQGSAGEGGQIEFSTFRHDVSTEVRVEKVALTISPLGLLSLPQYTAGLLKTDANGNVSLDTSTYLTSVAFSDLTSTPTTLAGYGITDSVGEDNVQSDWNATSGDALILNKPSIPVSGTDFDPVGTDNSTNVTLAGSYDYLTLSGQEITLGQIDYDTDIDNLPTLGTAAATDSTDYATAAQGTKADNALPKSGGTMTGHIAMEENHLINYRFEMIDNASPQYILLCQNAAANDVNGVIRMDRSSGNWQASSVEVIVSAGSSAAPYAGALRTLQVEQSEEEYTLVTVTHGGNNWIAIKYTGNTYPETSGAYFTGRLKSTITTSTLNVVSTGITNETAWGGSNLSKSYLEVGDFIISSNVTLESFGAGYLKTNVNGVISNTATIPWSTVSSTPTTISGYGITDAFDGAYSSLSGTPAIPVSGTDFDPVGTDNSTDVTLVTTSYDYLSITGQEITLGQIDYDTDIANTPSIPVSGTDFDPVGTDNSTDVTLVTTSHDYLSLSGQAITLNAINLNDINGGATAGILTTNASGVISVDTSSYLTSVAFSDLTTTPTTIAGYGITDAFDGAYSSLTGTPALDNYVEWYLSGDADTQDITSGKWVKFEGASSITGLGTEVSPYIVDLSGINTDTQYTAGAGVTLSGTEFNVNSDLTGVVSSIGIDTNDKYVIKATTHEWSLDGTLDMRLSSDGVLDVDGDVVAFSTVTNSDRRLKTNIETIENASEKVSKLRGVSYTWDHGKRKGQRDIGLIAQEVEEVVPEVVSEGQLLDGTTAKRVDYAKLVGLLIESNKELQAQVNELKDRLDAITK